jgi:hypothetical protein
LPLVTEKRFVVFTHRRRKKSRFSLSRSEATSTDAAARDCSPLELAGEEVTGEMDRSDDALPIQQEQKLPLPRVPSRLPSPMSAADTDAMVPALPTLVPPASRKRSIAASLARAHRRLALAADDAVVRLLLVPAVRDAFLLLSLASVWLFDRHL